jgi:hypothetical protein
MFNLFGGSKNTVKEPKILICSIGDAPVAPDKLIYQPHFNNITEQNSPTVTDFFSFMTGKTFDIVHLFVKVEANGTVQGKPGIQLLEYLSKADVKLIMFATNNPGDNYIKAFANNRPKNLGNMNIVMTLDREGDKFTNFFKELFDLMAKGKSMPMAWVQIIPQAEGPWQEKAPSTIFDAGRGHIKFTP